MLKTVSAIATQIISSITGGLVKFTGPSAGSTRVITVPDANATMARTDAAQTFTGNQTFAGALVQTGAINTVTGDFSSHVTTMNNNDTLTIPNFSTGFIEISEINFWGNIALIAVNSVSTVLVYGSDANITITSGNANTINVYRSGTSVIIESKNAAGLSVRTSVRKLG